LNIFHGRRVALKIRLLIGIGIWYVVVVKICSPAVARALVPPNFTRF